MTYHLHDHNNSSSIKRKYDDDNVVPPSPTSTRIQFFIRLFCGGKTLVLQGNSSDTVASVHLKIQSITGITGMEEQRLIYCGKQLQLSQTLSECDIQNDATLQLIGRMQSTRHPHTWKLLNYLNSLIIDLCSCTNNYTAINSNAGHIMKMLTKFLTMTPKENKSDEYLLMFIYSSVPASLVKLYMSPNAFSKQAAYKFIRQIIVWCKTLFPDPVIVYSQCAPLLLEFCKLLRRTAGVDDALYIFCRSSLANMIEWCGPDDVKYMLRLQDAFPFVRELATRLSHALGLSVRSAEFMGLLGSDVCEFIKFMHPVKSAIRRQEAFGREGFEMLIEGVHCVFCKLLEKLELCLKKLESQLCLKKIGRCEPIVLCWSKYLVILKELKSISKLYKGLEEVFWEKMRQRRVALCFLIVRLSKSSRDYQWILKHREVAQFKMRRRFALKMLREGSNKNEELYEMLICRSHLLEESFEYIGRADPTSLQGNLFLQFKNEEATGPGVLREWFSLVCQAIFNPQNALFVSCPNDGRRFFPNPASEVDPLHLEYFIFSGRMIALALMHKVQISIAFDRVFYLLLAGKNISFEDIKDADPYLYSGCKTILEMDTKMMDQDILGLTFVCEVEELGSRKVVELCPNGKDTIVNSENRDEYVNLLVQHRFVTSIAQQVAHFAQGFAHIITDRQLRESFFRILDHEDLDWMLYGSKTDVSVEDWRAHTDFNGYNKSDPQISWFWEVHLGICPLSREMFFSSSGLQLSLCLSRVLVV
ncbi:E3 ubiquitin-protein ligase UPL5-like isoform X2 [Lycium ferocissimum]|uniref:E3 ubiquitin-protein ligase UPL5-like isoform X2 n=1 Tax=Lycium ferocissimum TaxID=112874 RepID=UPI0028151A4D|nr:E3 ubiquitin-protein ligase UPL5-like isoform X2 [Lycium ferocissimum]